MRKLTPEEFEAHFWGRVDKSGDCWLWTACLTQSGYGHAWVSGRIVYAHRVAYELVRGPIPSGMQLDHLCRNRACVNPDHLEPVTNHDNILRGFSPTAKKARQTHCIHGHPFTGDNLKIRSEGWRSCRTCMRARQPEYQRRYRQRRREAAL